MAARASIFVAALVRRSSVAFSPRLLQQRAQSSARPPRPARTFEGVSFKKTDGILKLKVVHAKFRSVGKMDILHAIASEGSIALSITPPAPGVGPGGQPAFDWKNPVTMYLKAADVVTVVQSPITQPIVVAQKVVNSVTGRTSNRRLEIVAVPGTGAGAAAGARPGVGAGGAGAGGGAAAGAGGPPQFRLTVTEDSRSASVTVAQTEVFLLRNLVGVSLPWITGWQMHLDPGAFDPAFHLTAPSGGGMGGGGGGGGMGGGGGNGGDGGDGF